MRVTNKARERLAAIVANEAWQFKDFWGLLGAVVVWLEESDATFDREVFHRDVLMKLATCAVEEESEREVAKANVI